MPGLQGGTAPVSGAGFEKCLYFSFGKSGIYFQFLEAFAYWITEISFWKNLKQNLSLFSLLLTQSHQCPQLGFDGQVLAKVTCVEDVHQAVLLVGRGTCTRVFCYVNTFQGVIYCTQHCGSYIWTRKPK